MRNDFKVKEQEIQKIRSNFDKPVPPLNVLLVIKLQATIEPLSQHNQ